MKNKLKIFILVGALSFAGFLFFNNIEFSNAQNMIPVSINAMSISLSSDQNSLTINASGNKGCDAPCNHTDLYDVGVNAVIIGPNSNHSQWNGYQYFHPGTGSARWSFPTTLINAFEADAPIPNPINPIDISFLPNGDYAACVSVVASVTYLWPIDYGGTGYMCRPFTVNNRGPIVRQASAQLAIYETPSVDLLVNGNNSATIQVGQTATLSWVPTATNPGNNCQASGNWFGQKNSTPQANNQQTVGPINTPGTYTYTLTCTGALGSSAQDTVTLEVQSASPISITFQCSDVNGGYGPGPCAVPRYASGWLAWSTNADDCNLTTPYITYTNVGPNNPGVPSDSLGVDFTYTLTCFKSGAPNSPASANVTFTVFDPPTGSFTIECSPATVTIAAGSSTAFNISTIAQNGFSDPVNISHVFTPNRGNVPSVDYGKSNDQIPPATTTAIINTDASTTAANYSITFIGNSGDITSTCNVQLIVNPVTPPNAPIDVVASNSGVCQTITVTWSRGGGGTAPESFQVYHRLSSGSAWNQVSGEIPYTGDVDYSFTHNAPAATSNYYAVRARAGDSYSNYAEPSITPISAEPCAPDITTSDKDLIQVNSNNQASLAVGCNATSDVFRLPDNGVFKEGDLATFKISICNSGNQELTNVSVSDYTLNLSNLTNVSTDNCVQSFDGSVFLLNNIPPKSSCEILVRGVVTSPGGPAGTLYRFRNTAVIQSDQLSFTVHTLPYLFAVGSGVPTRTETAPQ